MTRQELLDKGFTEEQATIYLNDFHTLNNSKRDLEDKIANLSNKDQELEGLKAQLDAINKEKMTEQEKIELMKKEAEDNLKKANENLKQSSKVLNKAEVKTILAGVNISDTIIDTLVSDDKEKSIANATTLLESINSMKEKIEKETIESIANKDIKPTPGNKDPNNLSQMTWDKFNKLSVEEQNKFAEENPEEFKKL